MEALQLSKHKQYLLWQVEEWINSICPEAKVQISWTEEKFSISAEGKRYSEDVEDAGRLHEALAKLVQHNHSPDGLIESETDLPLLALMDWCWREGYLKDPAPMDKHKRIGKDAVQEEFLPLLKWPVFEMLRLRLLSDLGLKVNREREVIFSCDYDIADFWSQISFLGVPKQWIKVLLSHGPVKAIDSIRSFLNRKKSLKWNGCLTRHMFPKMPEEEGIKWKQIAFLLIRQSDPLFDPKNDLEMPSYEQFMERLKFERVTIGLHPAYRSRFESSEKMQKQREMLESLIEKPVADLRFHYLNAEMPRDFRLLEQASLERDYSYAFADGLYFRGGRSTPGRYWDFNLKKGMGLVSYPLTMMDTTLVVYAAHGPVPDFLEHLSRAWQYGRSINILFHNQYFDPYISYPNAKQVRTIFDQTQKQMQALAFGNEGGA